MAGITLSGDQAKSKIEKRADGPTPRAMKESRSCSPTQALARRYIAAVPTLLCLALSRVSLAASRNLSLFFSGAKWRRSLKPLPRCDGGQYVNWPGGGGPRENSGSAIRLHLDGLKFISAAAATAREQSSPGE